LVWVTRLLRPYWGRLAIAFAAMLLESGADLLEPWPLKIIFDYVIDASTRRTGWWRCSRTASIARRC
jgi:ABC-type multidrug transport system fused ATPase/permease subunit